MPVKSSELINYISDYQKTSFSIEKSKDKNKQVNSNEALIEKIKGTFLSSIDAE